MSEVREARAAYDRAWAEMDRLTSATGGPGAAWRWSIPANEDRDSDLIFAAALEHMPRLLDRLAAVEALADEWERTADSNEAARGRNTKVAGYYRRHATHLRAAITAAPGSEDRP